MQDLIVLRTHQQGTFVKHANLTFSMEDKVEKADKDKIKMGFQTDLKFSILSFKFMREWFELVI